MAKQKWVLEIDGDATGAEKAVEGLNAKTVAMGNILSDIAKGAVEMLGNAVKGLGNELLKTVEAAAEANRNQIALGAAMQQAGTYTKEAYQHNIEYSEALQQVTTYTHDQINLVQKSLTNFGLEGDLLDKVTKATLDLATAKGMDLREAGDLVAKSIGSTTNALTRYGIEVGDSTDKTERAKEVVESITKIFGGSAQAQTKTFSGGLQQLKNSWQDLYEEIGVAVVGNSATTEMFKILKGAVEDATKYVGEHKEALLQLVKDGFVIAVRSISLLVASVNTLQGAWTDAGNAMLMHYRNILIGIKGMKTELESHGVVVKKTETTIDDLIAASNEEIKSSNASKAARTAALKALEDEITAIANKINMIKAPFQSVGETVDEMSKKVAADIVLLDDEAESLKMLSSAAADAAAEESQAYTDFIDECLSKAKGYTEEQLSIYTMQKAAMQDLLAANKISQEEYNDWHIKEGRKFNDSESVRTHEIIELNKQMYSTIASVSKTQSDLVLKDKKNSMAALEDAFKGSLSQMLDMAVDYAVKEIGVTAALESGKAAAMGLLSFGSTILLIPLIAAAATAAKAVIHSIAGFAEGGIVGPGGSRIPLPGNFGSSGADNAIATVRTGEVIGTPGQLAATGVGSVNVYFTNYGAIGSNADIENLGAILGNSIQNKLRGSI